MKKRERERETHIDRRTVDGKREREIHWKGQTQREREREMLSVVTLYMCGILILQILPTSHQCYIYISYICGIIISQTLTTSNQCTRHIVVPLTSTTIASIASGKGLSLEIVSPVVKATR